MRPRRGRAEKGGLAGGAGAQEEDRASSLKEGARVGEEAKQVCYFAGSYSVECAYQAWQVKRLSR